MKSRIVVAMTGAFALAAFALGVGRAGRAMAASGTSDPAAIDDSRIARRVLALNRSEERTADAVKGKVVSIAIWQLAERISVDHAALDEQFERFVPADGRSDGVGIPVGRAQLPDLSNRSGDDLEQAYVDREVRSHEAMLATIDHELIPAARSDELQRRLADLRLEVVAHLQYAKNLQHAEWIRQTIEEQRADIGKEIGNDGP